jgi:capsular polysaccharide biosynthesis protein
VLFVAVMSAFSAKTRDSHFLLTNLGMKQPPMREGSRTGGTPPRRLSSKTVTAGDVYRALWRHKFFIVALTAVFVGATWYVTSRETRTYEASTLARVQERGPNSDTTSAALLAQTYAKLISSGALNDEIRELLGRCSRVSSTPSRSARAATRRMCNSLGGASGGRAAPRMVSEVELSGSPVEDLDLLSITARSRNPTSAMVVANATPLALRTFIRRTGTRNEQIVIAKPATTPSSPVSRHLPLNIAIALMLGLIFNGALALLIELLRDRLPDPDELGQAVGHPVLSTIPTLRLHPVSTVEAPREEPQSVLTVERSLDGEGNSRATSPRVGRET